LGDVDVFPSAVPLFDKPVLGLPTKDLSDLLLLDLVFPVQFVDDLRELDQTTRDWHRRNDWVTIIL
jgi:hypothetical protein